MAVPVTNSVPELPKKAPAAPLSEQISKLTLAPIKVSILHRDGLNVMKKKRTS